MTAVAQRWRHRLHSWQPVEGRFDPRRFDVGVIADDRTAAGFVQAHHYSGSYPAARLRYGLYEGADLVGVAVLSVPAQKRVLTSVFPDLEPYREALELGRFVLLDGVKANAETWFLARVWEFAAREGVRGVVSFSDPAPRRAADGRIVFPGHWGTIYQAANALHLGRGRARRLALLPDGTVLNSRTLQKIRSGEKGWRYAEALLVAHGARPRTCAADRADWLAVALREVGVREFDHPGNIRYAFRVGPRRRLVRVGLPSLPYPKADEGQAELPLTASGLVRVSAP